MSHMFWYREDTGSVQRPHDVANFLQTNGIVVDSVLIGGTDNAVCAKLIFDFMLHAFVLVIACLRFYSLLFAFDLILIVLGFDCLFAFLPHITFKDLAYSCPY